MSGIDWLRTLLLILGIIISGVAVYFRTIHQLEQRFRDKIDEQNRQINDLKIEVVNLKNKDELQQLVIDQFKKQVLDNLPAFYDAINQKDKKK
jgi:cell division protein FtsL